MTQDEYEQLLQLGGKNEDITNQLKVQQMQAQMLRGMGAQPEMRGGNVKVAANPLEHIAAAIANGRALQSVQGMGPMMQQQRDNRMQQNKGIMKMILGTGQDMPQPAAAGTGMNPMASPQGFGPPKGFNFGGGGY